MTTMKAKGMVALFAGLALMTVALAISQTGCGCYFGDAGFRVRGTVYGWVNAPSGATSKIYAVGSENYSGSQNAWDALEEVDNEVLGKMSLVPLEDAELNLDEKARMGKEWFGWPIMSHSDGKGKFDASSLVSPQRQTDILSVTKPGYLGAVTELESPAFYYVVVVLVKE